jgi:hypothetical protein
VLALVAGNEAAGGGDHPPPRQSVSVPQDVADGPGRTRVPGLLGNLAVGHHVTRTQAAQNGENIRFERHGC